ncbi:four helix bundle protein [Marinifilum sp. D737]|uniref:four helix bundle protein n=1 Tax=Marinifilum sp. D737 TaxID=2969628 RepID=UPI0022732585|nr:four helix bundle protein [Marinifilum sp. D737]MCY1633325.1 four helix bundle protein [Marinifilum sp. D737]
MKDFRKLNIWQQGVTIVKMTYRIVDLLPETEKYGLRSQMCRAAVSVPSNIAEGCSRNSDSDFRRYLDIALGSLFELETQLIISEELKFVKEDEIKEIIDLIQKEEKMVNSLITKLKANG